MSDAAKTDHDGRFCGQKLVDFEKSRLGDVRIVDVSGPPGHISEGKTKENRDERVQDYSQHTEASCP